MMEISRRGLLAGIGAVAMPFGESRTSGFSNPPLARLIVANSILTKNGLFFYSGKPALGNLLASIGVASAGVDKFGNAYRAGDTAYKTGNTANFAELIGGAFTALQLGSGGTSPAQITSVASSTGSELQLSTEQYPADGVVNQLILNSPAAVNPNLLAWIGKALIGGLAPTTTAALEVQGGPIQTIGLNSIIANGNLQSQLGDVLVSAGNVNITTAGKGVLRTGETWHVVGAAGQPPFLNSFSAGGSAPRFQVEAVGGGRVRLSGAVNTGAVNAAGTAMFTLPVGYRPSRTINFVTQNNITAYTLGSGSVEVHTTGDVVCVPATTAGKFVLIDGICFELD